MSKLSKFFSYEEVTVSQTASRAGIDNSFPPELLNSIQYTAGKMDEVREFLGSAVIITSWYRSPELNSLVGSKSTSAHIRGEAVDFISPRYGKPYQICKALMRKKLVLNWDQLILEHTWMHIAFTPPNPNVKARNQVLSLLHDGTFTNGVTDKYGVPL